jgi:hypothetical protein
MADPNINEDIIAAGPAEVHTPNMRVIAHDIEKVDKVMSRRRSVMPTMGRIGGSVGIPKPGAYSRHCRPQDLLDDYTDDNCECT